MTRIQDEHGGESKRVPGYLFGLDDLYKMPKTSILMHPMPKREEIDPRIDFLHRDPRVMYLAATKKWYVGKGSNFRAFI